MLDETPAGTAVPAERPSPAPYTPRATAPPAGDPPAEPWAAIAHFAARTPHAPALGDSRRTVTYGELAERVRRRSARLRARGIGPGDVVGILLPRGADFAETVLAVWHAGAAYLPLDPAHGTAWTADGLRQAGAVLCLTRAEDAATTVSGLPVPVLDLARLDAARPPVVPSQGRPEGGAPEPGSWAYLIRTSGSTGRPKLVPVTHGGLPHLVAAQRHAIAGLGPGSVVLQVFTPLFDGWVFDLLLALGHGGHLEVLDGERLGRPLHAVAAETGTTHATVPAVLARTLRPADFPGLRVLLSAGDVCLPETARRWAGHVQFVNGYGPTEATVCATLHTVDPAAPPSGTVPVGRPVPGRTILLLDDALRPVPDGAFGEICIGGWGLTPGYVGDPEETARRLVEDPTGTVLGLIYRTGDRGRLRPDGALEFAGRLDAQTKVNGYRVDPAQVEAALVRLPGVRDAVVVADEGVEGRRLLGYVRLKDAAARPRDARDLRAELRDALPAHLVPAAVTVLDAWPLTASGKVDRSLLPPPGRDAASAAPASGPAALLSRIAGEVLGTGALGAGDSFTAHGGGSLQAMAFTARVRAEAGLAVPLRAVLEGTGIAALAAMAVPAEEDAPAGEDAPPLPRPAAGESAALPPCSAAQQRVWLAEHLSGGTPAYHAASVARLRGPLRAPSLRAALQALVGRHEVLRCRLPVHDGTPRYVVDRGARAVMAYSDLRDAPDAGRAASEAALAEARRPFDLAAGPLIRWHLLRTADEEHVLVQTEHHAVHDGHSARLLLADLVRGYAEHVRHGRVAARPAAPGYGALTAAERHWAAGPGAARQRAYWRTALDAPPPPLPLPPRTASGSASGTEGAEQRLHLDAELMDGVRALGRAHGATDFMVAFAAYLAVLHRATGARDVLVGSGMANRRRPGTAGAVGMFVNTVVLRGRPRPGLPFSAFLAEVRATCLDAYEHQELPFEEVIAPHPRRAAGEDDRNRLVQTVFSFHDTPLAALPECPLDITVREGLPLGAAKFDLGVTGFPHHEVRPDRSGVGPDGLLRVPRSRGPVLPADRPAGLTLTWQYATSRLDDDAVRALMDCYEAVLRAVVDRPHTVLDELPCWAPRAAGSVEPSPSGPGGGPARAGGPLPSPSGTPARGQHADALARLMGRVLGVPDTRPADDFLALGGDSLGALRFTLLARAELGLDIPLKQFLRAPTALSAAALARPAALEPIPARPRRRPAQAEAEAQPAGPARSAEPAGKE
ncbi:amino acid adenylation domain-containing protein [Streptomyces sp. NPDC057854]|uniref:amino acid adenylation domain-containing protein n=1 Tax=Streptomyces sp. NPDC057854 TaxID=3346264 RepID=UPI0036A9EAEE